MKNKIERIEFFYYDSERKITIIGANKKMYGSLINPLDFLNSLCESEYRVLDGSKELFKKKSKSKQKIGILVNPEDEEIYFPTHAYENKYCMFINYGQVKKVTLNKNNETTVNFKNGTTLAVATCRRTIYKQLRRCREVLASINRDVLLEKFVEM